MIGFLRGILLEKYIPYVLIDINGIGYEVHLDLNSFSQLSNIGEETFLYVHLIIRDNAKFLYGFNNKQKKLFFCELIKINGVGPKIALSILSVMNPEAFIDCLNNNETSLIENIPGIGNKIAKRIIIELKDKINFLGDKITTNFPENLNIKDAIYALIALGYKPYIAKQIILNLHEKNLTSSELVRSALKAIKNKK